VSLIGLPTPEDDAPDPAAAAVLGKVRRLMLISLAFTGVAVAAVLGVIGYRVSTSEGSRPATDTAVALPKGARVIATAVADSRIVVTLEVEGRTEIRVFDLATLSPRGSLRFTPAP
jgi:hypothetical protein